MTAATLKPPTPWRYAPCSQDRKSNLASLVSELVWGVANLSLHIGLFSPSAPDKERIALVAKLICLHRSFLGTWATTACPMLLTAAPDTSANFHRSRGYIASLTRLGFANTSRLSLAQHSPASQPYYLHCGCGIASNAVSTVAFSGDFLDPTKAATRV